MAGDGYVSRESGWPVDQKRVFKFEDLPPDFVYVEPVTQIRTPEEIERELQTILAVSAANAAHAADWANYQHYPV